ncbi:MAG TPA: prolyl oligopeptidase family serine peptidase [Thermoanaerobaculia bacterium]|nr:prolyl oligopeptidase family serine peptidase [Thermoanaerobaculia bacterium]
MKRLLTALLLALPLAAQTPQPDLAKQLESAGTRETRAFEDTQRMVDDEMWYHRLGDIADIDKYEIASSKPRREKNPTDVNAGNMLILPVYVFVPKNLKGKAPMLIFVHGGVHGRLTSNYAHIFREGLERGYIIVSPEYRGSIGNGGDHYSQIDYGGAEIDDTHDTRNWAIENLPNVDASRIGIFGWSHGGYHTLMNILQWPDDYKVAYAGVPVSDLVARLGYSGQGYRDTFEEFIGKQIEDNVMEYRRRSPVFHAEKLRTPLLIHTTTNDEDVNVLEVEHMIAALKAAGKKFEYKIYENAPGGHRFNRIDTKLAKDSRKEMWDFLGKYLK